VIDKISNQLKAIKNKISSILETVEGTGSYFCNSSIDQILPGIYIENFGEIAFPFNSTNYQSLQEHTQQAPFGKGSKTVVDVTVRSSKEIDAKQIQILNQKWPKKLKKILKNIKGKLGIENKEIAASLYKLLIYKEGDFFLPHKDSEKEKGMFGTLIIGMPAKHTGGELVVEFNDKKEQINFADDIENYEMPYVAFFADCKHEIKPITSGYRLCLVYNLIQTDKKASIKSPTYNKQVVALSKLFTKAKSQLNQTVLPILLDHQYTPSNFSSAFLKPADLLRANTIIEAAKKAGYHSKLALLTCYQSGDLEVEYGGGGSYYGNQNFETGDMGEVHESYLEIAHWVDDGTPSLGEMQLEEDNFVANYELTNGDPIEREEDTYTGNWGMTVEYWYHYGAVVIWPIEKHKNIINAAYITDKIEWLSYYVNNTNVNNETHNFEAAKALLLGIQESEVRKDNNFDKLDFSKIVNAYIKLNDDNFVLEAQNLMVLASLFSKVEIPVLIELFTKYTALFEPLCDNVIKHEDIDQFNQLLKLLLETKDKLPNLFIEKGIDQIKRIPEFKMSKNIYNKDYKLSFNILKNTIKISKHIEDATWQEDACKLFNNVELINRKYTNKVLLKALLSNDVQPNISLFTQKLFAFCELHLKLKTIEKPQPPANWIMEVPDTTDYYQKNWDILREFLESPNANTFDFKAIKAKRLRMEEALRNFSLDLAHETIRKGSPHTLRITKTQATYKRDLKNWEEDLEMLGKLRSKI